MRPRHTRRSDASLNGPSVQKSLRLPAALVSLVDAQIEVGIPEVHTLTDAVTDALWLWIYESKSIVWGEGSGVMTKPRPPTVEEPVQDPEWPLVRPTFADVDLDALEDAEDGV